MKTKVVVTIDHDSSVASSGYLLTCIKAALYDEFHELDYDGSISEEYEEGIIGVDVRHESSVE